MPPWMRQIQTTQQGPAGYGPGPTPGSARGAEPGTRQGQMGGFAAPQQPGSLSVGSLVSEDALPQWMRGAADAPGISGSQSPQPGFGAPPAASQWGQAAAPAAPQAGGWGAPPMSGQAGGPWQQPAPPPAAQGWAQPAPPPAAGQPYQGSSGFATPGSLGGSALFDDAALPEWLRNAAADQSAAGAPAYVPNPPRPSTSGDFPQPQQAQSMFRPSGWSAQPPTAQMQPGSAGGYGGAPQGAQRAIAPGSMSAQSLLDASALPTWLGGSGAAQPPNGPAMALGGDGLSAQSLIDERSLPIWLRQEPATPAMEPPPAGSISQWLAAPVTDEPLPSWLNQVYSSAQVPRIEAQAAVHEPWTASHAAVAASSSPAWYRPAVSASAMSLGQLADDRSGPGWQAAMGGPLSPPPSGPPESSASLGAPGSFGSFGGTTFGAGGGSEALTASGEAAAAFSASDLIDPDALPAWVQQEVGNEQPTFNSATGWTSKNQSLDASIHAPAYAPVGAPAAPMAASPWANGPAMSPARDGGEANLPPWLRQGSAPAYQPGNGIPAASGAREPARGGIPDADLPPWLRGSGGRGPGNGNQPMAPAPAATASHRQPEPWGGPSAGSAYAPPPLNGASGHDPAWDGPLAGSPRDDGPVRQYADLFADELPGASRRFSYDVDHTSEHDDQGDRLEGDEWEEPRRGKPRRRWFGKR